MTAADIAAAEARAAAAKQRLTRTVGVIQERLAPQTLAKDAVDSLSDAGRKAFDNGVETARANPAVAIGGAALAVVFLARRPLIALFTRRKRNRK